MTGPVSAHRPQEASITPAESARGLDGQPSGDLLAQTGPPPLPRGPTDESTRQLSLTDIETLFEVDTGESMLNEADLLPTDSAPELPRSGAEPPNRAESPPAPPAVAPPSASRAARPPVENSTLPLHLIARGARPAGPAPITRPARPPGRSEITKPPLPSASKPEPIVPDSTSAVSKTRGERDGGVAEQPASFDWRIEREFYLRESDACAADQPQHAAVMSLAAAIAGERADDGGQEALQRALGLAGNDPELLPLLRELVWLRNQTDTALELAMTQQERGGSSDARIAALLDAYAIVRLRRHDGERALRLARRVLELQPGHPIALFFVATAVLELRHDRQSAKTLEQLGEVLQQPLERACVYYAAGTLQEFLLGSDEQAALDYRLAIDADPDHVPAVLALKELQRRTGDWAGLCATLTLLGRAAIPEEERAHGLLQAAILQSARLGSDESAARSLERAAELAPKDPWPLSRLACLYEAMSRHDALVGALRRLLQLRADDYGRAAILTRIGGILEARLHDVDGAIAAYRQALTARPAYTPAVRALQRLYRRRSEWEALLEVLHQQAEGCAAPSDRALYCMEAAQLLSTQLGRPEDAIAFLQRAFDLDPTSPLAFWPLRRLLEQQKRPRELAELLEAYLARHEGAAASAHLRLELARLQAGPLGEPAKAIETLQQALEGESSSSSASVAVALSDLLAREGRLTELAELLLRQADGSEGASEAIARRLEAARLLDVGLGEHERAAQIYARVFAAEERNGPAASALCELYHRLGQWKELAAVLRRRAETDTDPTGAAELWCSVGQLEEDQLAHKESAIEAYRKALALDPSLSEPLAALERLLLAERRPGELVELLGAQASKCSESSAAADLYGRAAELSEHACDNLQQAEDLLRSALEQNDRSLAVRMSLFAIQCRREAYAPATETLEQLIALERAPERRGHLQLQLARLREHRLNQPADISLIEAASEGSLGKWLRLERLRSARLALPAERLAALLLETGEALGDAELGAALLLEAAYRFELGGEVASWVLAAEAAAGRSGTEQAIRASLRRAYHQAERWADLARACVEEADAADPRLRQIVLLRAAMAYLWAGQRAEATRLVNRCMEGQPRDVAALRLRGALANADGDWPTLGRCLEQLASSCSSSANRLAAALQAAEVWEGQLHDRPRALASLMLALREDPLHPDAYARAIDLLEHLGRHGELAQLQLYRLEHLAEPAAKVALLREHARLLRERLQDPSGAVRALALLLQESPGDVEALEQSVELLVGLERWSDAEHALRALIEQVSSTDPERARTARLERARICFERLQQPDEARKTLVEALEVEPANTEVKRLLVRVDIAQGQWTGARETLEQLATESETRESVWAMCRLAEVARVGLADEGLRERWEREAVIQASADRTALSELVQRYRERDEAESLANIVGSVLRETTSATAAALLRITLAALLVEDLQQPDRALEQLRECLVTDPQSTETQILYALALEQKDEAEQALACYRKLLAQAPDALQGYRGVLRLAPRLGALAIAGSAASVLDLLGAATAAERAEVETLENSGLPGGVLGRLAIEGESELGPTREVLELAAPHLGSLYRLPLAQELAPADPVRAIAAQLARALDLPGARISVEGSVPARAGVGHPPPLHVSSQLAGAAQQPAFRFWLGRALGTASGAGALIDHLSDSELTELVEALCTDHPIDPAVSQLRKRAFRAIPRKVRKQIELISYPRPDEQLWRTYRAIEAARADRIGLLLSGSPRTAFLELALAEKVRDDITRSERIADLIRFALSDEYTRAHRVLWSTGAA